MVELKDNGMKNCFVIFFLHFWQLLNGQMTLDFQSKQPFLMEVNGHVINAYPCERVVFDVMLEELKCDVKTTLIQGGNFNQSFPVKQGFKIEYQLGKDKKEKWKWTLLGESMVPLDTTNLNNIPSLVEVFEAHGKCIAPMKPADFNALKDDCLVYHRSEDRFRLIVSRTSEICCSVEQVTQLLSMVELEDEKLELLVELVDKIYNWGERKSLIDAFFTERGQQRAALLLQ